MDRQRTYEELISNFALPPKELDLKKSIIGMESKVAGKCQMNVLVGNLYSL